MTQQTQFGHLPLSPSEETELRKLGYNVISLDTFRPMRDFAEESRRAILGGKAPASLGTRNPFQRTEVDAAEWQDKLNELIMAGYAGRDLYRRSLAELRALVDGGGMPAEGCVA